MSLSAMSRGLKSLAESRGVRYKDCGGGHIQLRGVVLVNYYPNSKKQTAYIAGMVGSHLHCSPERAVALAATPEPINVKTKRSTNNKRFKRRLMRTSQRCHWCHLHIAEEIEPATVDHVIPLSRGGLENNNNRVLSCRRCNHDRDNDMPNEQYKAVR